MKHLIRIALLATCLSAANLGHAAQKSRSGDLFALPLEDLLSVRISGVGSLTETQWRHKPASVTRITRQDIERSGARSLDELLETYVPGFQVWLKTNGNPMGLRGIISDRNTKMLLLVNGRLMNEHTSLGIISERYLSLLGDIQSIDVTRGPGSSVYGPGAIAGVINIKTLNGDGFDGQDIRVRAGAGEEFYSMELRSGTHFESGGSLFAYYGIDQYKGADHDDAEMQFSLDFTNAINGQSVPAHQPVPFGVTPYNGAHRELPRHKLHLEYQQDALTAWARYTRGGIARDLSLSSYTNVDPAELLDESFGYQQGTITLDYQPQISPDLRLDARLSADVLDIEYGDRNYREDEWMGRLLAHWQATAAHQLSGGVEYSVETFGKKSLGYPHSDPFISNSLTALDSGTWRTDMLSLLLDYQWHLNNLWTLFAGGRSDRHAYTDWMHSPRLGLVYEPDPDNQYKLLLNRSVRRADDDNLREYHLSTGRRDGRTETMNALELAWEHQWDGRHRSLASLFFNDYDLVGWDSSVMQINRIGTLKTLGLELELHWQWQQQSLALMYSYVAEQDFKLDQANSGQFISASVYGYGDDLANWANHSLKLIYTRRLTSTWEGFTSLRYLTGLDGSEAMADYNRIENNNSVSSLPRTDGSGKAYEDRAFWTLGLRYNRDDLTLSLHGYNLLGLFDSDWNRRNAFGRSDQYRLEAPAFAVSAGYRF
ncbi:MAG: TonB-dependent receptor [Pseudomonadota bacterium]|nr:TonB-dependent receptor [Pseudomonadota bacterium]